MHMKFRNVNDAFRGLVGGIHSGEIPTTKRRSRNGPVIQVDEPVIITYEKPRERVLFNAARDCNPCSLTYESMWMLAGRNDVAPLAYYTKNFANYSDDGKTLSGAYGYRWRHANSWRHHSGGWEREELDQLNTLVAHLKADPNSRRAVLTMWNTEDDLLKIGMPNLSPAPWSKANPPMIGASKDTCCNLSVLFSIRQEDRVTIPQGDKSLDGKEYTVPVLDITVTNRSNDLIWGLLNANYCCFSVLQEYMAARLEVEVGVYNHFTNNLHCYKNNWKPEEWLDYYDEVEHDYHRPYANFQTIPLVKDPEVFEKELPIFAERNSGKPETYSPCSWQEPFFNDVAQPLCTAFRAHKEKWGGGVDMWVDQIKADDWRTVAAGWFARRKKNATVSTV